MTMNTIKGFQAVVEHFKQGGWGFEANETEPILRASFNLRNGRVCCVAIIEKADDLLQFFSFLPVVIPPEKRPAVAEVCLRASYRLTMGAFEMDFERGEVRFHTSALYRAGELTDDVIQRVIGANLFTTDVYFPAFMTVVYGGRTAREAVQQAEQIATKQPDEHSQPPSRIIFN